MDWHCQFRSFLGMPSSSWGMLLYLRLTARWSLALCVLWGVKRVAIGEMGDFGHMQRAGSLADASCTSSHCLFAPPPRAASSHQLAPSPPPSPPPPPAVYWRRLLAPSPLAVNSHCLLAPPPRAVSSRRLLPPSLEAGT